MAGFFSASAAALFAPFVLLVNSRPGAALSFLFGRSTLFVAFFNMFSLPVFALNCNWIYLLLA
jgi:hypothetical protein